MTEAGRGPERRAGAQATSKVRVHWVNQYAVPPDQPGGTRHHEMSSALRARGYDVRVIASDLNLNALTYSRRPDADDRRAIREDVAGVPFVWLNAGSYERNDWRRALSMLVFAGQVLLHLLRTVQRGDLVIGSSPQLLAAGAARLAALVRGAPFVLEVRDLWPESLIGVTGRGGPMAWLLRVVADLLYRTSSAVVVLAEGNREPIIQHGGPPLRIVFVPNGVDVSSFERQPPPLPDTLGWIPDSPTFVYAGAHGPANGLEVVLDAAQLLIERDRADIRVLLVGGGPIKADLAADARRRGLDNVTFHDPVPKQVMPAILRRCQGGLMVLRDVELFRYGVSPNKLFDYLAADLPVITNVAGDVATTVERANGGVVVPPGKAGALADAMVEFTDQAFPGGSGLAYVREHHDRHVLADRLARVIDGVSLTRSR